MPVFGSSGIEIKGEKGLEKMQIACRITGETLMYLKGLIQPGITTAELDRKAEEFIRDHGAIPSFLNYGGFPGSICASVNEQVVHGIPGKYELKEGDIISIDVGACIHGYHGDAARTYGVGQISPEAERLIRVTRESFFEGIRFARSGNFISDISAAVQNHAESNGYGVVRELIGHGIGRRLHEAPDVPNFVDQRHGRGARLKPGMTIAVEPMINQGGKEVLTRADGWTVITKDRKLSAHYENTIAITDGDPIIMTLIAEDEI